MTKKIKLEIHAPKVKEVKGPIGTELHFNWTCAANGFLEFVHQDGTLWRILSPSTAHKLCKCEAEDAVASANSWSQSYLDKARGL